MQKLENNYAFIDGQNLNRGIREQGWILDFKKFKIYLKEKYGVIKAYFFIGYIKENEKIYNFLRKVGYILIFKPIITDHNKQIKGNVDTDLVLKAILEINNYDKAIIVSSDGDFYCLVRHLHKNNKLKYVLSSHINQCSSLLKIEAKEKIIYINRLRNKLEYLGKQKSTA